MQVIFNKKTFEEENFQVVERKGTGHPDTLADNLAEFLSVKYSNYTKDRYGAVLHHNFDKLALLGGASFVEFGDGYLTRPIRVLLNGRVSSKFGDEIIPVSKLLTKWIRQFLAPKLDIDPVKDIDIHDNISTQSSPGKVDEEAEVEGTRHYWFEPRGLQDLQELKHLVSNDTSLGVGFAPMTTLEQFVIDVEHELTVGIFKKENSWIGSDVKLMGIRNSDEYYLTLCIPQIGKYVHGVDEYRDNIEKAHAFIRTFAAEYGITKLEINSNTRDNFETSELYLTATGSSIESGDEGVVGRGNRINKIITPTRPMSMEGASGKNPVYHIGKLYYVAAHQLADNIYKEFHIPNEVFLVSQSGRLLKDPWMVVLSVPHDFTDHRALEEFVHSQAELIPAITDQLLAQKYLIS
jgi:S-adenosylmethionine synthetase